MQTTDTDAPGGSGLPRRTLLLTGLAGAVAAGISLPSAAPA